MLVGSKYSFQLLLDKMSPRPGTGVIQVAKGVLQADGGPLRHPWTQGVRTITDMELHHIAKQWASTVAIIVLHEVAMRLRHILPPLNLRQRS